MADAPAEEEVAPKPSKLPLIIGCTVSLLVGGGGGFGAGMMMSGDADAAEVEEEPELTPEELEAEIAASRATHSLGQFDVNLRGGAGGRVLRAAIDVETTSDQLEAIEANTPMLRDTMLTVMSDYTYQDLEGTDGKTRLRDELLGRANTMLPGEARIDRIYFTAFVVQ